MSGGEDEYEGLAEEEKLLLADIYPELSAKLTASVKRERERTGRRPTKKAAVLILSSGESDDDEEPKRSKTVHVHRKDKSPVAVNLDSFSPDRNSEEKIAGDAVDESIICLSDDDSEKERNYSMRAEENEAMDEGDYDMEEEEEEEKSKGFLDDEAEESMRRGDETDDGGERSEESADGEELDDESLRSNDSENDNYMMDSFVINDDDGDESMMSVDKSFREMDFKTPPPRRVLPSRSAKTFTSGRSLALPPSDYCGDVTPSSKLPPPKREEEEDDDVGEESFERYIRKVKQQDEKKRRAFIDSDEDEEDEPVRDDSFVVSDDAVDVIDDSFEEEEEFSDDEGDLSWSTDEEKENEQEETKKKEKRKDDVKTPGKNRILSSLADSFKSPSVQFSKEKERMRDDTAYFVMSLSDVYEGTRHSEAEPYVKKGVKGEKTREALVQRLFICFNAEIFDNKLPSDLKVTFNPRLRKTAGYCKYSLRNGACSIELSPKVCTTPERIRDTLAHEMCHAAVNMINGLYKEAHGPVWKSWASRFPSRFRGLPVVTRCHDYDIEAKYIYECQGCGQLIRRHSKSLDLDGVRCGRCHNRFALRPQQGKERKASAFALFVKEHYGKEKKGGTSHREIMQTLSARFKQSRAVAGEPAKRVELDLSVMSIQDDDE